MTEETLSVSKEKLLNKIKADIQLEKDKKLAEKQKEKEPERIPSSLHTFSALWQSGPGRKCS